MSYPEGWAARAATEPWTGDIPDFYVPGGDVLYDPILTDHLFLTIASAPTGEVAPDEWVRVQLTLAECAATEPITIGGSAGLIGVGDCNAAAVTTDGRGYLILLYTSADEAWLSSTYNRAWFEDVLATVELRPDDPAAVAQSASP